MKIKAPRLCCVHSILLINQLKIQNLSQSNEINWSSFFDFRNKLVSEEKELRATINFNKILLIFELVFFSSSIFSLIHAVAILAQAMAVVGFNVEASAQLEEDGRGSKFGDSRYLAAAGAKLIGRGRGSKSFGNPLEIL